MDKYHIVQQFSQGLIQSIRFTFSPCINWHPMQTSNLRIILGLFVGVTKDLIFVVIWNAELFNCFKIHM